VIKAALFAVVGWMCVSILGFVVFDFIVMPFTAGHFKATVSIPELIKLTPEDAKKKIEDLNLICVIDSSGEYSPDVTAGLIVKQRPSQNTKVKEGRRIWLTISKGLRSVKVPNIIGTSVRQAEIILQRAGLKMGELVKIKKPGIPEGVVFNVQPTINKEIEINSNVTVMVSSGYHPGHATIKNLIGMSLTKAKKWIIQSEMVLGKIEFLNEENKLPNTVLSQNPISGEPILKNQPINLVVSQ